MRAEHSKRDKGAAATYERLLNSIKLTGYGSFIYTDEHSQIKLLFYPNV